MTARMHDQQLAQDQTQGQTQRPAPHHARAFVALGANLGNAVATVQSAIEALRQLPHTQVEAVSPLYRTAPVGLTHQPDFINGVVELHTALPPYALLEALFTIEAQHGRERLYHHSPRTLDLDLLMYDDLVQHDPVLTLPHPRMHERAFVLMPLAVIAADLMIPDHGPVAGLLPMVADQRIQLMEHPS